MKNLFHAINVKTPIKLYEKILKRAEENRRTVTAEVIILLEKAINQ